MLGTQTLCAVVSYTSVCDSLNAAGHHEYTKQCTPPRTLQQRIHQAKPHPHCPSQIRSLCALQLALPTTNRSSPIASNVHPASCSRHSCGSGQHGLHSCSFSTLPHMQPCSLPERIAPAAPAIQPCTTLQHQPDRPCSSCGNSLQPCQQPLSQATTLLKPVVQTDKCQPVTDTSPLRLKLDKDSLAPGAAVTTAAASPLLHCISPANSSLHHKDTR